MGDFFFDLQNITENTFEPIANPLGIKWADNLSLDQSPTFVRGRIVDAIPFANAYRVNLGIQSIIWCSLGSLSGFQPHGARQLNTLPIGCMVYVLVHPQMPYWGTIVCVDPEQQQDMLGYRYDNIGFGRLGGLFGPDAAYIQTLQQPLAGGAGNWCNGLPVDQTNSGEWGAITETGLAIFLDSFLTYMRVSEECGLFLFYHDQLTRLAGHNFQLYTTTARLEDLDDQGECTLVHGRNPYFWEGALGAFTYSTTPYKTFSQTDIQNSKKEYGVLEPLYDDQQAFDRWQEYAGYVGQGVRYSLCLPPITPISQVNRYQDHQVFPGVYSHNVGLDGSLFVHSSKGIIICKRPPLPIPKQIKRPENPAGDNPTNYKYAGLLGAGVDHKITDDLAIPSGSSSLANQIRVAAILDKGAFEFNWKALHPFAYKQDWYTPQEGDPGLGYVSSIVAPPPNFGLLATTQYLVPPNPISLKVDHRYGNVNYFPNEAYLAFPDDGGFVLSDGYGGELKMAGGSLTIACPGDVWIQPGKNLNCWAGWDVILRALNSADISASNKDVHIKAEHNLMMLAGNDVCGGVVIESKSPCPAYDFTTTGESVVSSGIVLKAKRSQVVLWGQDIIAEALGVFAADGSTSRQGHIILDAIDGKIRQYAAFHERFAQVGGQYNGTTGDCPLDPGYGTTQTGGGIFDFFVDESANPISANEYWSNGAMIGSPLRILGGMEVVGCCWIDGWIFITDGHIASDKAASYSNQVVTLTGADLTTAQAAITDVHNRFLHVAYCTGPQEYDETERNQRRNTISTVEFSLRGTTDYRTTGMVLFETHWQQQARLNNTIPDVWIENSVVTTESQLYTYPHPGIDSWINNSTFYLQDLTLYDTITGKAKDRTLNQTTYENPSYKAPTSTVPDGAYPIIRSS